MMWVIKSLARTRYWRESATNACRDGYVVRRKHCSKWRLGKRISEQKLSFEGLNHLAEKVDRFGSDDDGGASGLKWRQCIVRRPADSVRAVNDVVKRLDEKTNCRSLSTCIKDFWWHLDNFHMHLCSPQALAINSYEKQYKDIDIQKQYKHIDIQCTVTVYLTNETMPTVAIMYQNYRYKLLYKHLSLNYCSKLTVRFANVTLGRSKPRQYRQNLAVSMLLVTNCFIKNDLPQNLTNAVVLSQACKPQELQTGHIVKYM